MLFFQIPFVAAVRMSSTSVLSNDILQLKNIIINSVGN